MQKLGQRQEKDFFIAWNEGKKKQISLKARIRTARFELHLKYFHWYYKAASVARRQRKAANILLNFGEDRYYTNTMKNWQKIMLTNMRERVLGAVHRSKNMNATRLACLEHRRKCKHIARNFLEWRLSTRQRPFLTDMQMHRGFFIWVFGVCVLRSCLFIHPFVHVVIHQFCAIYSDLNTSDEYTRP